MGKAKQALSMWRGRVGSIVYSSRNGQQIMSAVASKVTNPKTDAQVMQRMKLAPAQNFYRQLEGLVAKGFASHTFQGKQYGNANRLRFLQLAMLNNQGPYVPKDTLEFIPFDYQISEGSLPSFTGRVYVEANEDAPDGGPISNTQLTADNVQKFADALGCNVGDQVSILYVEQTNAGTYVPYVLRFLVQAGVNLSDVFDGEDVFINLPSGKTLDTADYGTAFIFIDGVAGCAVLSRETASGSYLRSTEFMVISNAIRSQYYTAQALKDAIASYNGEAVNSVGDDYYNDLSSNQTYNGRVSTTSAVYLDSDGSRKNATIFFGFDANGQVILFTSDGGSRGGVIARSTSESGWTVLTKADGSLVTISDLTSSDYWADVDEWNAGYYTQWKSGQKAVRPDANAVGGSEDTPTGNPT